VTLLRGTTWAHARSVAPLAAASQWFADGHPGLSVTWSGHTARQFGEGPVEPLADEFDLVCIDHPHVGHLSESGAFLPASDHLAAEVLAERERASAGRSFESYRYGGKQWAIPIDAACTMAAWSPAKCGASGIRMPVDLDDACRLAADHPGSVIQPFSRMTTTALFFAISASLSNQGPQRLDARAFPDALATLGRIFSAMHGGHGFGLGSIEAMALLMRDSSPVACVPFAYPYACFARSDLLRSPLRYAAHPRLAHDLALSGVLGGAGIAVSTKSKTPSLAFELVTWLTSAECQSTFIAACLGQPADRCAWSAGTVDSLTGGFYSATLPLLDAAWLRPTDRDFQRIQSRLADVLCHWLIGASSSGETGAMVDQLLKPYTK
jgi:multiple sugar transport system substrate-binding protein